MECVWMYTKLYSNSYGLPTGINFLFISLVSSMRLIYIYLVLLQSACYSLSQEAAPDRSHWRYHKSFWLYHKTVEQVLVNNLLSSSRKCLNKDVWNSFRWQLNLGADGLDKQNLWCKVVPVLNQLPHHEDILGSGGIAPHNLNLSTKWTWMVSFTLWPLYPWAKISSTHCTGGWVGPKASLDAVARSKSTGPGLELNPNCPAHNLVTTVTELPWLTLKGRGGTLSKQ